MNIHGSFCFYDQLLFKVIKRSRKAGINIKTNNRAYLKNRFLFFLLAIMLIILIGVSLSCGRYHVPIAQMVRILLSNIIKLEETWTESMYNVVMVIRLPRVVAAALVGAALALSGTSYQSVFHNPLVSPDLLGVSSGAGVGASIAILLHASSWVIQAAAFIVGIIAVSFAICIARLLRNQTNLILVLSGVIVSGFMSAMQGMLKYMADTDTELPSIVYWLMGSFSAVKWSSIAIPFFIMIIAGTVLLLFRWRINLLSLSDAETRSLGVNVSKLRGTAIICSTLLTACAVCLGGTISWIGLIIPHLSRLLVGEDNQSLMPVSALLGASFLLLVDTFARNVSATEIPISVLTGLISTPIFVIILLKKRTVVK